MAHEVIRSLTTFQGGVDIQQQRCWLLKALHLLGNGVTQTLWTIGVRGWLSVSFACRRYPVQFLVFLLLLGLFVTSGYSMLETLGGVKEVETSSLLNDTSFVLSAVAGLLSFFAMLKQLRGLVSQTFTKELLSYVKLPSYAAHIGEVSQMREDIRLMCNIRLGGDDTEKSLFSWGRWFPRKRLLFVVDDLDRCDPKGIVKAFEAIRLILDIPHVTVVLAIDQRIALAAMAMHYKDLVEHHTLNDANSIARDYLGKMIQLPIVLDEPNVNAVSSLMADLWNDEADAALEWQQQIFPANANMENKVENNESTVNAQSEIQETLVEGEGENDGDKTPLTLAELTELVSDLTPIKPPTTVDGLTVEQKSAFIYWSNHFQLNNPRQLKRLHNSYNLLQKISPSVDVQQGGGQHLGFGLLVSLLLLEYINNENDQILRTSYKRYVFDEKKSDCINGKSGFVLIDSALSVVDAAVEKGVSISIESSGEPSGRVRLLRFVELFVLPVIESDGGDKKTG